MGMDDNKITELGELAVALKNYWSLNPDSKRNTRSWARKSEDFKKQVVQSNIALISALVKLCDQTSLEHTIINDYPNPSEIEIKWNSKHIKIIPFFNCFNYEILISSLLKNIKAEEVLLIISSHPLTKNICMTSSRARENGFNLILASPSDLDNLAALNWTINELIQYKLFRIYLEGGIDADAQYVEWEMKRFREYLVPSPRFKYIHSLQGAIKIHKDKHINNVTHPKLNSCISSLERSKEVLLLGKSASGKTTLALSIGERLKQKNINVYYVDIGTLNSESAYRIGTILFNLCIQSKDEICLILDDIQTQSGISKNLFDFLGLLNKSILGKKLQIIACSWPGYSDAFNNPNLKFSTIFIEASDIIDRMIVNFGSNLSEEDRTQIKEKAGEDLLLLRLWLEISNVQRKLVNTDQLASVIWKKRVGKKIKFVENTKRLMLITSVLGLYEIETPIKFLEEYAEINSEDIKELTGRKLLIRSGESVSPPHRSFARLLVNYLYKDEKTWNWFKENHNGIKNYNDILLNYFEMLAPNEIWETLELINMSGGIKTSAKSQVNVKLLIDSWKQIDELKKKICSQIEEDPTWRNSLSSSTFACVGLSSLGRYGEAQGSYEFIRDNYEIIDGKLKVFIQNLSTIGDFEKILENMKLEERDETFPTTYNLERSTEIDLNLFHENWASGIVLISEAAMNRLSPKELEELAISVEKRFDIAKGFFYPSRVPWCTARILTGLGQCGRNIENSEVVKKAAQWLLGDRVSGGGRQYVYWAPGTDGWNTPEETTAMCIIALRSVGVPSTNEVLNNAINWLHNQKKVWKQAGYELDRAIAAEAHLSMNRSWEDIRTEILQLATWANNIALWRNATLTAQKSYDQTCKVAQVGAFIINVMWKKLSDDLPQMLSAIGFTPTIEIEGEKLMKDNQQEERFEIAITYASENRQYVKRVVKCLRDSGHTVFYDEFESAKNIGVNLYDYFDEIYGKRADYCVMFISKEYAEKVWTTHERRSAQARALLENKTYILPIRLDDTEIPGIPKTVLCIDAKKYTTQKVCGMIIEKIESNS